MTKLYTLVPSEALVSWGWGEGVREGEREGGRERGGGRKRGEGVGGGEREGASIAQSLLGNKLAYPTLQPSDVS